MWKLCGKMWTAGFWSRFTNERFFHGDFTDDFEPCGKTNFTHSCFFKNFSRSFHGGFHGHRCVFSRSFHGRFHGHRHIFSKWFSRRFSRPFLQVLLDVQICFFTGFLMAVSLQPASISASCCRAGARGPKGQRPGPGPPGQSAFFMRGNRCKMCFM